MNAEVNLKEFTRFIIIGQPRTGTTFLQTLLQSHPQITSYGELFHLGGRFRTDFEAFVELVENPKRHIRSKIFRPPQKPVKAVGFKIPYDQLFDNVFLYPLNSQDYTDEEKVKRNAYSEYIQEHFDLVEVRERFHDALDDLIRDDSIKIIHTKRRNILETKVSFMLAKRSGVWHSNMGTYSSESFRLDFEDCLAFFEETRRLEEQYDALFSAHDMLTLIYEEMMEDKDALQLSLQEFLGVDFQPLQSHLKKQNKKDISKLIANYAELKAQFAEGEWSEFFIS
ncbi:MAG TPA: sulfotransferase [Anaerolineales bacterium]|nr:sulfotransferase [Anaerolineales bacterium]